MMTFSRHENSLSLLTKIPREKILSLRASLRDFITSPRKTKFSSLFLVPLLFSLLNYLRTSGESYSIFINNEKETALLYSVRDFYFPGHFGPPKTQDNCVIFQFNIFK